MRPKHQNVSKTDAVGHDSANEKNSKPKHGFGGFKVLPKATVPSEGSLKGNCMHEATMPSEGVVERKFYA